MNKQLPTRLGKSPLVEAIFEVRFSGDMPLSSIITGMLFTQLGCTDLERLAHSEIPESIRRADPNLKYIVLSRLTWGKFFLAVGDNVVTISPTFPYPGWGEFQEKITELTDALLQVKVIKKIERFSLKYIDVLDSNIHPDIDDALNFRLDFGGRNINKRSLQIRAELPIDGGVHVVQIIGQVQGSVIKGPSMTGIMVDVDSIRPAVGKSVQEGVREIQTCIQDLHDENKSLFFEMLTESGLKRMEPTYE